MDDQSIAVLGVGQMGRSALSILLRQRPEARFVALDREPAALAAAVALDPGRVAARSADLTTGDIDLSGCAVVLNLAGPFFTGSDHAAGAAINAGIHYVDVADDAETTQAILDLDREAIDAGVSLLTGAGLSPGMSNWMACQLLEQHPGADGIQVVWVVHEPDPGGLAPLRHMLHMAVIDCPVWDNGELTYSTGFNPSTAGTFAFPEPFGDTEAYDTAHPEPLTLPRRFTHLRYVGCKGALQPAWANSAFSTLGRIGFGYHDIELDLAGITLSPAEVLWKLLWKRYEQRGRPAGQPFTAIRVSALRADVEIATQTIIDDAVMARGTGLGAATAVDNLLTYGAPAGAHGVEVLDHHTATTTFHALASELGAFRDGVLASEPASA
jgi:lysine 6-dehydrogenase